MTRALRCQPIVRPRPTAGLGSPVPGVRGSVGDCVTPSRCTSAQVRHGARDQADVSVALPPAMSIDRSGPSIGDLLGCSYHCYACCHRVDSSPYTPVCRAPRGSNPYIRAQCLITDKKLSYRRGTARCVVSVEIFIIATQQCSTTSPKQIEVMKLNG